MGHGRKVPENQAFYLNMNGIVGVFWKRNST